MVMHGGMCTALLHMCCMEVGLWVGRCCVSWSIDGADSHVDSTTTLGIGRGVVDTHSLIEITQVA